MLGAINTSQGMMVYSINGNGFYWSGVGPERLDAAQKRLIWAEMALDMPEIFEELPTKPTGYVYRLMLHTEHWISDIETYLINGVKHTFGTLDGEGIHVAYGRVVDAEALYVPVDRIPEPVGAHKSRSFKYYGSEELAGLVKSSIGTLNMTETIWKMLDKSYPSI